MNSTNVADSNTDHLWKSYGESVISHSIAHYLTAINHLNKETEKPCRSSDISRALGISRNAVSLKIRILQRHNLISIEQDRHIKLSEKGLDAVNNIIAVRRATKRFLVEFLGISETSAEKDSCRIEHLISEETRNGLIKLMQMINDYPDRAKPFIASLKTFDMRCEKQKEKCPLCQHGCLVS